MARFLNAHWRIVGLGMLVVPPFVFNEWNILPLMFWALGLFMLATIIMVVLKPPMSIIAAAPMLVALVMFIAGAEKALGEKVNEDPAIMLAIVGFGILMFVLHTVRSRMVEAQQQEIVRFQEQTEIARLEEENTQLARQLADSRQENRVLFEGTKAIFGTMSSIRRVSPTRGYVHVDLAKLAKVLRQYGRGRYE